MWSYCFFWNVVYFESRVCLSNHRYITSRMIILSLNCSPRLGSTVQYLETFAAGGDNPLYAAKAFTNVVNVCSVDLTMAPTSTDRFIMAQDMTCLEETFVCDITIREGNQVRTLWSVRPEIPSGWLGIAPYFSSGGTEE